MYCLCAFMRELSSFPPVSPCFGCAHPMPPTSAQPAFYRAQTDCPPAVQTSVFWRQRPAVKPRAVSEDDGGQQTEACMQDPCEPPDYWPAYWRSSSSLAAGLPMPGWAVRPSWPDFIAVGHCQQRPLKPDESRAMHARRVASRVRQGSQR